MWLLAQAPLARCCAVSLFACSGMSLISGCGAQDKNPGADARAAFEALNKAHRELKDPGSRVREW